MTTIAEILKNKGDVYSVAPDAMVHDAIAAMATKGIAAVLVIADKKLVGIFSAKDYGTRVVLAGRSGKDTRVREVMTSPVVTVKLEASVDECMSIMTKQHIRHLPVFDAGEIVGVVSLGDLASAIIAGHEFHIEHLMIYMGLK